MPLACLAVVDAQRRALGAKTEIRATPMVGKRFRSDRECDPIAELAQLIAQADGHERRAPSDCRSREQPVLDGHDETPELPAAPQLAVDLNVDDQASERVEHCSDDQGYEVDGDLCAAEEQYRDSEIPHYAAEEHHQGNEVPRVRRPSLTLAVVIFGLVLVGTACVVGYRDMFGGSVSSALSRDVQTINGSGNPREADPAITGSIDDTVPREDRPAAVRRPKVAPSASPPLASATVTTGTGQAVPNRSVPRTTLAAPAPRLTVAAAPKGPGRSGGENDKAISNHERLDPNPVAHASSDSNAVAAVVAGSYAVQVNSEHSESRAQAAFRSLQAKYPNQLGGHQPIIRRVDLGAAGIYYRALVGPFASAGKAAKLCGELKAAGGDCIIQKN
jgi:hypothetical protein